MKNKNCINRIVLTDQKGLNIGLLLQKGTAHDTNFLIPLIDQANDILDLPKQFVVHADKGFDSLSNRWQISQRDGKSEIPVRNIGFSTEYPKQRDRKRPIVEHCFAWLNSFKSLKNIYVKTLNSLYELHFIAFITILMRSFKQKTLNN